MTQLDEHFLRVKRDLEAQIDERTKDFPKGELSGLAAISVRAQRRLDARAIRERMEE